MSKLKNFSKYISLISLILLLISEFLNLLFQGTIYNYYVDKAISCDSENEFWNIAKDYKQIGVMFSNIGNILFVLLVLLLVFYIALNLYCYIMNKNKSE